MPTVLWKQDASREFSTPEHCHIIETYNSAADESLSIARARVQPGVTTEWHQVERTIERYIIAEGRGRVEVGDSPVSEVGPGDVVIIPAGTRQRITNIGDRDLIFYCVCTPRFRQQNYRTLTRHVQFEHWVPFPIDRVFLFFANPQNLPRLMPPETDTRIDTLRIVPPPLSSDHSQGSPLAGVGSEIYTSFRIMPGLPFRGKWIARITEFESNHHFADIQIKGPFHSWHHRHEFATEMQNGVLGTIVRDQIDYSVGYALLGKTADCLFISRQLQHTFRRRQEILPALLAKP